MSDRHVSTGTRRGTVFLLCLMIVSVLTVMAFAFVRIAQMQRSSNLAVEKQYLAQEAARYGLRHAMELLVRDFQHEPYTRNDQASLAAQVALTDPRTRTSGYTGPDLDQPLGVAGIDLNEVSQEHDLIDVMDRHLHDLYGAGGNWQVTGLGRYYEVEFYNHTANHEHYAGSTTSPIGVIGDIDEPVLFGDNDGTMTAPDRADGGVFLDSDLLPVGDPTSAAYDPVQARFLARYRLRYAFNIADLEGALYVNGGPAIHHDFLSGSGPLDGHKSGIGNFADHNPSAAGDTMVARLMRSYYQLPAVMNAMDAFTSTGSPQHNAHLCGGPYIGDRMAHIWLGRGVAANLNVTNGSSPTVVTWPLMYRRSGYPTRYDADGANSLPAPPYTDGNVIGRPEGGEEIAASSERTIACLGAINSPWNLFQATHGFGECDVSPDGLGGEKHWRGMGKAGSFTVNDRITCFGRGMVKGAYPYNRFQGPTDTPWCVNVLTATPKVIHSMISGYMPPGARSAHFIERLYVDDTSKPVMIDHDGDGTTPDVQAWDDLDGDGVQDANEPLLYEKTWGSFDNGFFLPIKNERDLFVSQLEADAFTEYSGPTRTGVGLPVSPDYHLPYMIPGEDGYREPDERYPGPIGYNGYVPDDLEDDPRVTLWSNNGKGPLAWNNKYNPGADSNTTGEDDSLYRSYDSTSATNPYWQRRRLHRWHRDGMGWLRGQTRSNGQFAENLHEIPARDPWSGARLWINPQGSYSRETLWKKGSASAGLAGVTSQFPWLYDATLVPFPSDYTVDNGGGAQLISDYAKVYSADPEHEVHSDNEKMSGWWEIWSGTDPESIWEDVGAAMATAIEIARASNAQYDMDDYEPGKHQDNATHFTPITSIAQLDEEFVRQLGHLFSNPRSPTPVSYYCHDPGNDAGKPVLYPYTPTWNVARLNTPSVTETEHDDRLAVDLDADGTADGNYGYMWDAVAINDPRDPDFDPDQPSYSPRERTQVMELIINDFRLSFFGSNPAYAHDFRPLDFNGDGKVACSGYRPADPTTTHAYYTANPGEVPAAGQGDARDIDSPLPTWPAGWLPANPSPDPSLFTMQTWDHPFLKPSGAGTEYKTEKDIGIHRWKPSSGLGEGPPVDHYFSHTGVFNIGKSRFYKITVRGEVWDNFYGHKVGTSVLESVWVLDPVDATKEWSGTPDPGKGMYSSHCIYQRWLPDLTRGNRMRDF